MRFITNIFNQSIHTLHFNIFYYLLKFILNKYISNNPQSSQLITSLKLIVINEKKATFLTLSTTKNIKAKWMNIKKNILY